jgi:hypothetical protein
LTKRTSTIRAIVVLIACLLAAPALAGREERAAESDAVLRMDRVLTIRLRLTGEQWRMMQPERASRLATQMGVVQRPTTRQAIELAAKDPYQEEDAEGEPVEGERRPPGLSGWQYAYVKAQVDIDGERVGDVGLRFKGQSSYSRSMSTPRRPLKLKFDHFVEGQEFHGLQALALGNNIEDPSFLRDTIGHALLRDAGLPAARTCLALVYLTVDGLYQEEPLGLYTAIEDVNKDFLHRSFDTTKGLLVRAERTRNLAYLGEDWCEYDRYNVQSDATPFTAKRFIDFTKLVHHADDESFHAGFGTFVDTDEFARFLAMNVLMVNTDSILVNGHNYWVHVHPKTGRLAFIAWDFNFAMAARGTTLEEWAGFTIDRPFRPGNRLLERVLATGPVREAYRHHLREVSTGICSPARMNERLDLLEAAVKRARELSRAKGHDMPEAIQQNPPRPRPELREFFAARVKSVLGQLDGQVEGDPVGGRRQAPPPPKPVMPKVIPKLAPPPAAKPVVVPQAAPRQKENKVERGERRAREARYVAAVIVETQRSAVRDVRPLPPHPLVNFLMSTIDPDHDGRLTCEELCDATKHVYVVHGRRTRRGEFVDASLATTFDEIGELLDPFPEPAAAELVALDPARPRPTMTWATALVRRAGQPSVNGLTLDESLAAMRAMFAEADVDGDGSLNGAELSAYLDVLVPRS